MALYRAKQITRWLEEILQEPCPDNPTEPKNKRIARILIDLALDNSIPAKTRLAAITEIIDRREGKPVQTNLNADVTVNPFEGVPTEQLEALRAKLEAIAAPVPVTGGDNAGGNPGA